MIHCERCGAPVREKRSAAFGLTGGIFILALVSVGGVALYRSMHTTTHKDSSAISGRIQTLGE